MANDLTLSTLQLIETIAVLASNISLPPPATNLTGLLINSANNFQFPDNATNQALAATQGINSITTGGNGRITVDLTPSAIVVNNPSPADGPFGAGTSTLSTFQLIEAIAVLAQNVRVPFPRANITHLILNGANQLQFPDNIDNQALGANTIVYGDGTFIYISLTTGQPASGG